LWGVYRPRSSPPVMGRSGFLEFRKALRQSGRLSPASTRLPPTSWSAMWEPGWIFKCRLDRSQRRSRLLRARPASIGGTRTPRLIEENHPPRTSSTFSVAWRECCRSASTCRAPGRHIIFHDRWWLTKTPTCHFVTVADKRMSYEQLGLEPHALMEWTSLKDVGDGFGPAVATGLTTCPHCVIQSLRQRRSLRTSPWVMLPFKIDVVALLPLVPPDIVVQETTDFLTLRWRCDHDGWYQREDFGFTRPTHH